MNKVWPHAVSLEQMQRSNRHGAVYVVGSFKGDGFIHRPFKVGMVGEGGVVASRFSNLQISSPLILAVAHIEPTRFSARHVEALIHAMLRRYHARGEWFNCSGSVIMAAIKRAIEYETEAISTLPLDEKMRRSARRILIERGLKAMEEYRSGWMGQ